MPPSDPTVRLPEGDGLQRLRLGDGRRAVCKRRRSLPAGFFAAEAHGHEALRAAGGLRVPEVFALGSDHILLEDLGDGRPGPGFHAAAGRGLARQHARPAAAFGFDGDGWCGDSPQDNTPDPDGHRFFAQRRLLPQARRAHAAGRIEATDMARVEALCARLPELVPPQPPVLLHGDLWTGNLHCCANGAPALVDAGAAHHGWAEADLAMLVLFGAPPAAFFDAYAEAAPLARDWRGRAPLYNLYHLLNHLNLFGGGYLPLVRAALARY
jgi:fructosamine-3-kinase